MILYRASLETSHFSFEAYGATRSEAYNAMRAGMEKHALHTVTGGSYDRKRRG